MELAGEAEKLAKRLHPRDEEASECHAVDTFLGALDRTLAAEVQKLGHRTMEDVVAAARRIEKILEEQTDTKMERLVSTMQDQIRLLKKDLKKSQRADRCSQNRGPACGCHGRCSRPNHSKRCSCSTASCRPRSPHLPGLQRGAPVLSPSPLTDGSSTPTLFPLRRRRPLRV